MDRRKGMKALTTKNQFSCYLILVLKFFCIPMMSTESFSLPLRLRLCSPERQLIAFQPLCHRIRPPCKSIPSSPPGSLLANNKYDDPFGDYDDDSGNYGGQSQDTKDSEGAWGSVNTYNNNGKKQDTSEDESSSVPRSHFFSQKDLRDPAFRNSRLFDQLCQGAGIERPSRIQALAWPILLEGKNAIVADQTGSGKTLAYLIPLLQRALASLAEDKNRRNGAPRLLVLAPTAELADQIKAVCDKLAVQVPFRSMVVTASGAYATSIRDQIRLLQRQPVDVMISTPGRIATILRTRKSGLDLSSLQALVLDEVDILLIDETFGPQLREIGAAAPVERTQFVFCTATLPNNVVETVEREFPGAVQVKGPGLHRVAPTVKENLVDVSVPSQYNRDPTMCFDVKAKQLLKSLRQNKCRRTLIFCNTVESCRSVENLLSRKDRRGQVYQVGAYHNAMTPEARIRNLRVFSTGKGDQILVCTDRAARGVDFEAAPVDHVILFDFPKDPAEYVRRVGRTARAGRTGTSTVFAYGWQLPIARQIMGNKLESFTVASDEMDDDEEYLGGAQRRKQQRSPKGDRERMIKGSIEGGKLWKE
jgi:ATP-dependent RNA helicase DDX18/HAS1